ncbi:hypothetical protein SAMN04489859_102060 [Paracoccus alcaliphilus]|uniref:Uncharacterized protein n=1 Tax=Paracoccus alcaliphilus TaxID=34002 RepID=A0A1H8K4L5_9RHOB|nr:hypothetical protein [Paracoccus alcaliphilus]WCR17555.1 hypothetical protein JHW40_14640 [Paracoccus alcaliphilus]SEN87979.1 hypothetical protein SAMN04489859_102060 [Paracoccus alcaliphilus]
MDFFEQLATLCSREMTGALKDKDADRVSCVIEGLATMLGRSIARGTGGDGAEIEKLLMGCESHVAAEAAGMAGMMNLQAMMRERRGGSRI